MLVAYACHSRCNAAILTCHHPVPKAEQDETCQENVLTSIWKESRPAQGFSLPESHRRMKGVVQANQHHLSGAIESWCGGILELSLMASHISRPF